jgi:hyaluronan synthase
LGEKCTFGDDRHLTNRVLLKGKKVIYTPYALGHTDSPSDWSIYLRQQTRWSKSYFREFLFNLQSIHLHPIWMCFELCYNVSYFFLLMYLSIYILYFAPIYQQTIAIIISVVIGLIKGLYGVVKTKNWYFLYFYLYSFVYYLIIIPSKITALITLWDTKWGTRGKASNWLYTYWCFILWMLILCGGFSYTIYKNQTFQWDKSIYVFAFVGFLSFCTLILITVISEFILRKYKVFSSELEKDILEENKLDIERAEIVL